MLSRVFAFCGLAAAAKLLDGEFGIYAGPKLEVPALLSAVFVKRSCMQFKLPPIPTSSSRL